MNTLRPLSKICCFSYRAVIVLALAIVQAWVNPAFSEAIHDAARDGDLAKVMILLKEKPALISCKEQDGETPLHWAAYNGSAEVAQLLIANHADVNATDNYGNTPLHWAVGHHHRNIAELLLSNRANVDARDKSGLTPLHFASMNLYKDMVELLLANKANVNAKDNRRVTALHWVALPHTKPLTKDEMASAKAIAEVLLANHANVNARDIYGETPLSRAESFGNKGVAELLYQEGKYLPLQPSSPYLILIRTTIQSLEQSQPDAGGYTEGKSSEWGGARLWEHPNKSRT